jgi:hypothetical protein
MLNRKTFTKTFRATVAEFASNYGLTVDTNERQAKNGTISLYDPLGPCRYTLHTNGYVRRKYLSGDQYQLNRVKMVKAVHSNITFVTTERIPASPNEQLGILASVIPSYRKRMIF